MLPQDVQALIRSFLFYDEPKFKLNKGQQFCSLYCSELITFVDKRENTWIFKDPWNGETALSEELVARAFQDRHYKRLFKDMRLGIA